MPKIDGLFFRWLDGGECCSALAIQLDKPEWMLHIGLNPFDRGSWEFGHSVEQYDQCADYWAFGPIFRVVRWNGAL